MSKEATTAPPTLPISNTFGVSKKTEIPSIAGSAKSIRQAFPEPEVSKMMAASPPEPVSVREAAPVPDEFKLNSTSPAPSGITEAGDCRDDPPPLPPDPAAAQRGRVAFT
jgi:hypothetical protein